MLTDPCLADIICGSRRGAIAQLGERYNGIVEVVGSIPTSSTKVSEVQGGSKQCFPVYDVPIV